MTSPEATATESATQPELVDLLIVGGGPAGIAAALRGRELGLSVRILEADDTMRRIRDYSKHKHILPGFGGGDRMAFPEGGEWIAKLPFEPIDKDDLVAAWKDVCREAGVEIHTGVEMTGLTDFTADLPAGRPGGGLHVEAYDHRGRTDTSFAARHVALAVGRGVPRRFDIPGDTAAIARRLSDANDFVGAPVCVIGGGTSAAEAVIAISQAKDAAGDQTPVNWSYRGDRLPRVSKALAEAFFSAYVGNGNIRYRPLSEPMMVTRGEDHQDYLAIRIDRRHVPDRPVETTLLEFPVERCLACVGEDVPESFLTSLGIPMVSGGARGRKRIVVNRLLESRRPQVYLLGDLLSQAYLETPGPEASDFDGDPAAFREVRHRGNIKSALHDGVRVAEVVKQRLDGIADADVQLPEIPETAASPASPVAVAVDLGSEEPGDEPEKHAWLLRLVRGGAEGEEYQLTAGAPVTLGSIASGSSACDLAFPDDPLMAPLHATVDLEGETAMLRDGGAPNGVFLQLPARDKLTLREGDLLRAGRQFLLAARGQTGWEVVHYRADGTEAGRHALKEGSTVVGRKADLSLDPEDAALSRRQLAFTVEDDRLLVKDLLSVNGTYLRIQGQRRLRHGDRFLAGQQRFAFSTTRDAVFDQQGPAPKTGVWTASQITPKADDNTPSVTFQPSGKTCAVAAGQTILDVAEANGVAITAECRAGICGSDPLRIVKGRENLDADPTDGEAETLEDLCGLEAGPCRLACMARVKGPVVVEVVGSG